MEVRGDREGELGRSREGGPARPNDQYTDDQQADDQGVSDQAVRRGLTRHWTLAANGVGAAIG